MNTKCGRLLVNKAKSVSRNLSISIALFLPQISRRMNLRFCNRSSYMYLDVQSKSDFFATLNILTKIVYRTIAES